MKEDQNAPLFPDSLGEAQKNLLQSMFFPPPASEDASPEEGFLTLEQMEKALEQAVESLSEQESAHPCKARMKRFCILLSGVPALLEGYFPDTLAVLEDTPAARERVRRSLAARWGITTRQELLDGIGQLILSGDRAKYEAYASVGWEGQLFGAQMDEESRANAVYGFAFARQFAGRMDAGQMLGWDLAWATTVIRQGCFLELICPQEAEEFLLVLAEELTEAFHSWRAFGRSCLFGGLFCAYQRGGEAEAFRCFQQIDGALRALLDQDEGPWYCTPWLPQLPPDDPESR